MAHSGQHFQRCGDNQNTALDILASHTGLDKSVIKQAAQKGAVWLTKPASGHEKTSKPQRIRRLKRILQTTERIDFYYNPEILNQKPPKAICLVDKQAYSIWLKPRGMFSQGSKWADFSALYRWVELHFQTQQHNNQQNQQQDSQSPRQCWIVHRLDRATQGLMLLAHSKQMARYFSQQFEQGLIQKIYQANVAGNFSQKLHTLPAGEVYIEPSDLSHTNAPHKQSTKLHAYFAIDGKNAHSEIETLYYCAEQDFSRLQITLHTGRKHQIRRHLQALQSPIIGDRLYSRHDVNNPTNPTFATDTQKTPADLQLTACQLSWTCPLTEKPETFHLNEAMIDLIDCKL